MQGFPSANCRVNATDSKCEAQLKQIDLFLILFGCAGEERLLIIE